MAEQDNHNVVNQLESTSGSAPLVDASLNHNITANALAGIDNSKLQPHNDTVLPTSGEHQDHPDARVAGSRAENAANDALDGLKSMRERENNTPDEVAHFDVSADASNASDNDTGRVELKDAQHNRTNSVKRPATFSKVSISKNFLAKAATSTPAAATTAKLGDKSTPALMATPALKPRLVAKSASSLSNASKMRNGAENSPAPDASTVWNKNRPAPAIPAKQFTDEELKQQYGIHLATRLQTDETGKGSKWADIDDDEDDWAPEAVVWMDGTKSSLTPAETSAVVVPAVPVVEQNKPVEAAKATLSLVKKLGDSSGALKTILKPGAAVAKQQPSLNGLSASSDKQAPNAKSPAPVPMKSPWATLPPIDKVSPVIPPVQQTTAVQNVPFVSQDARNLEPGPLAREIAADTFDRSWREGEGERRELFNSNNGKYEPAPEGRRNSIKHDAYGRKPSVLQRASQAGSESYFSHRRGSSVSHGSGPSARRLSYSKGSDSVISDDRRATPVGHHNPWNSQLPPLPADGGGEAAQEFGEDPVKIQERVMREKREAARLRRQEEEAKEEAAKQERLKAKLNALANAGQSRKERQAAAETPQPVLDSVETVKEVEEPIEVVESKSAPATVPIEAHATTQPLEHLSPSTASRSTFQSGSYRTTQTSAFSSPGDRDRKLQPFGRPANDSFTPWGSTAPSASVWSVSGIGNGTFESSSPFGPMASSQSLGSLPPPPGMARPGTSTRISPQNLAQPAHSPTLAQEQVADRPLPLPIGQSRAPASTRQQHAPGPIGPPSRAQPSSNVSGWQSASQRLAGQYAMDADSERLGALPEKREPVFKETFRQTGAQSRLGGPRVLERTEYSIHGGSDPVPPNAQSQPTESVSAESTSVRLPGGPLEAAEKATAISAVYEPLSHYINERPRFTTAPLAPAPAISNDSPPPPETSSHPVYIGTTRPNVRLPQPPPVVRLPPMQAMHMVPHRPIQNFGPQPLVKSGEWQARFNGLFNRTPIQTEVPPSPPGTPPKAFAPVLVVASSTRMLMDEMQDGAVVSLPRNIDVAPFIIDNSDATTSKDMFEGSFQEELGFGSRPSVRIPRGLYPARDNTITQLEAPSPAADAQSKPDLPMFHLFYKKPGGYYIKMPGSTRNRFAAQVARKPFSSNPIKSRARKDDAATSTPKLNEPTSQKSTPTSRKRSAQHKRADKVASVTPAPVETK